MAVIPAVRADYPGFSTITWTSITTADTGAKADLSDLGDIKTIHVVGAGTAQTRLSNDGTNFVNNGAALAANSINNLAATSARYLDINPVATNTVTVVLVAPRRRV